MIYLLLDLVVLLLCTTQVCSQCDPVEEGRPHTLHCTGGPCNDPILARWTALTVGESKLISNCDTTLGCTGNNEFFKINIAPNGDGYQSNLTIRSVSLTEPFNNEKIWTCNYCGAPLVRCPLSIYVKPVDPTCQATEVFDGRGVLSQINLTCTADRVYPEGKCLFQVTLQNGSVIYPQKIENSCTNVFDIIDLHEGENLIQAKVGSSRQPDFDSIQPIPVSPILRLELPKARIDCPGFQNRMGYYKGETLTCRCKLTEPGKPTGQPQWFQNGVHLASPPGQEISSSFNNNNVLICAGESAVGRETPGHTLRIAYLQPDALNVTTNDDGRPVNICCGRPGVSVICEIPASHVTPAANVGLLVNDVLISRLIAGTPRGQMYRWEFQFRPKIGGLYRVGCRIENAIFRELGEDRAMNVTIYSPVEFEDPTNIKRDYKVKIDPNNPLTIEVDITGYPQANAFTLYKGRPDLNATVDTNDLQLIERSPSSGTVVVSLLVSSNSNLTEYTLVMDNNVGDSLHFTFQLEEDTDDLNLLPIIIGSVAGALVIAAIIGVVCWRVRRAQPASKEKSEDDIDDENPYSEPKEGEVEDENNYEEYEEPKNNNNSTGEVPIPLTAKHAKISKKAKAAKDTKMVSSNEKKKTDKPLKDSTDGIKLKKKEKKTKKTETKSNPKALSSAANVKNEGLATDTEEHHEPGIPPPRPPPRKVQAEETYVNFSALSPGATYDAAEPSEDETEYLEVQEDNTNRATSAQAEKDEDDAEEDDYYSSINEGAMVKRK